MARRSKGCVCILCWVVGIDFCRPRWILPHFSSTEEPPGHLGVSPNASGAQWGEERGKRLPGGGSAKDVQSFTTHPSLCRAVFLSSARSHKSFRTCFLSLTISFCPCSLATLCSPKASTPRNLPQALAIWRPLPHFFLAEPNFVSAFHLFSYIVWKSMESLLGNKIFLYDGTLETRFPAKYEYLFWSVTCFVILIIFV